MREAVICTPLRTPIGRFGGALRDVDAATLATRVVSAVIERSAIDPAEVEDVVFGQCYPNGHAPAIGRIAALQAGLPVTTGGVQVDRRCGSGLQAICDAAMRVQTGVSDVVIAGGVESMSQVEHYASGMRWGRTVGPVELHDRLLTSGTNAGGSDHIVEGGMIETAENLRREYGISREDQDRYALRSHERAVAAQQRGAFDAEMVPIEVANRHGSVLVDTDEHPRADTTLDQLAGLRPVRGRVDPAATVTAGNASGRNDAAAACIVTTPDRARTLGLTPLGKLRGWASAGVAPEVMGIGPVPACQKLLDRLGLTFNDLDLIELNEAFAAQLLAVTHEWKLDDDAMERMNVNGSGISLGHPVGATGARIMATLLNEMVRRDVELGLETMCIGGGQGLAAVVERI